jgi:hypothetical protein
VLAIHTVATVAFAFLIFAEQIAEQVNALAPSNKLWHCSNDMKLGIDLHIRQTQFVILYAKPNLFWDVE